MRYMMLAGLLMIAATAVAANLQVEEFMQLPAAEQDRLLMSSYRTSTVMLSLAGVGGGEGRLAAEKMAACLQERELEWLRQSFEDYTLKHPTIPVDFGSAFAQAMAWKCGLLQFRRE